MLEMLKKPVWATVVAATTAALLTAPALGADSGDDPEASKVIAVVNGESLTRADFITFVNMRLGQRSHPMKLTQQQLNGLLAEYINRELIYQDAIHKGWDKSPEVDLALDNHRRNVVASYTLRRLVDRPPSEEALKSAYERYMSKPTKEYKARHILVKTQAEAQDVIAALGKGASFEKLAKERSVDASGPNGGELDWLSAGQMVQTFRDAVLALQVGTYTKQPVQSDYGWHVIKLEDTRIIPPPPYDSVKDQLRQQVQNEMVANYIVQLRKDSHIDVK